MPRDKCFEKNKAGRKGDKGKTRGLNKMRKQTSSLGVFQVEERPEQRRWKGILPGVLEEQKGSHGRKAQ